MKQVFLTLLVAICLSETKAQQTDSVATSSASILTDSSKNQYATLYVYRPRNFVGSLIAYNLHSGDTVICRVKNDSKYMIHLSHEGQVELWAKTEKKASVKINVEFGKKYYLKCGVKEGIMEGRPELDLVTPDQGELGFANIEGRENKKDDNH